jgi:hypothetical protein
LATHFRWPLAGTVILLVPVPITVALLVVKNTVIV